MIVVLAAAIINAYLYRLGGNKDKLYRRIGCSVITAVALGFTWKWSWSLLGYAFLLNFAIGSYWDSWFGYDNFWAHGFGIGLSALPLVFDGYPVWFYLARCAFLCFAIGLWSKLISHDVVEERGRGAIIGLSTWIPL